MAETEKRISKPIFLIGTYTQPSCWAGAFLLSSFCLFSLPFVIAKTNSEPNLTGSEYSFVYLGDMHFDQTAHHDFEWLQEKHPQDIPQIEQYVRNTEKYTPRLLKQIRALMDASDGQIQTVIQGGDLIEGLCGSYELQWTQFMYAQETIRTCLPHAAFIATKGNHDITGPGAIEAFDQCMLPWMSKNCGKPIESASFHFLKGPDLFVIFDAYNNKNPEWLEKTLKENNHRYAFVVMHPPVVPYSARATWHLFSRPQEKDNREKLLQILGNYRAIVLTGHLHKYCVLGRKTPLGSFAQLSMSSVISSSESTVKDPIDGVKYYSGALVNLEPDFQPDTAAQRRKLLEDEKEYITCFDYADFPGYAIVNVSDAAVTADIYIGVSDNKWKTVHLDRLLKQ